MDDAQAQQTNPLFGIIPKEFFTPLASPNRLVYWDCLCRLFQAMSAQLSFGIEREILVDELQFYFEQNQAAEFEEDDINGMDSRKKANEMLRLLEKYGWLEVETDKSYVQRVNFYDYAVKVMKTLLEISDGRKVEYQGYIYTIYSLVRTNTDHPAVVLQQIRDNTDMLITGLKNLNSNIKHYIDELTKHKTVAEIMNALFNDYITNIVDKAYHRLLTSDNVSKFRPEIIERLEANGHSSRYITKTSEELAAIREIPVGQAEELVYQTLHEIVEAFRNMDDILAEINRKNTQYQRAAVNRAKFLLAGTEDVRGQMKEFHPQELIEAMPDVELRQEKLRKMAEKMQRILSPERIERFVEEQLGDRAKIYASELPMETMDDFIRLIYVRLYGSRKKMRYRIEKAEGANKISGEFDFPDFAIIKR